MSFEINIVILSFTKEIVRYTTNFMLSLGPGFRLLFESSFEGLALVPLRTITDD